MDYKLYFNTDNKSGKKTKEEWLKKNNVDLYLLIKNNSKNITKTLTFNEEVFLFINNLSELPLCPSCGSYTNFNNINKGYNKYCSIKCLNSSNEHKEKIKTTSLMKYGVESPNQSNIVKENKKKSCLSKYGVENPLQLKEIQKKVRDTNIKKYGEISYMCSKEFKNKRFIDKFNGNDSNFRRMYEKISNNYEFINYTNLPTFLCKKCNNEFQISSNLLLSRYRYEKEICVNCNPIKSYLNYSYQITENMTKYDIIYNDRKVLNNKEIDILFKEHNLGVEINGLYWHSDIYIKINYIIWRKLI